MFQSYAAKHIILSVDLAAPPQSKHSEVFGPSWGATSLVLPQAEEDMAEDDAEAQTGSWGKGRVALLVC